MTKSVNKKPTFLKKVRNMFSRPSTDTFSTGKKCNFEPLQQIREAGTTVVILALLTAVFAIVAACLNDPQAEGARIALICASVVVCVFLIICILLLFNKVSTCEMLVSKPGDQQNLADTKSNQEALQTRGPFPPTPSTPSTPSQAPNNLLIQS